MTNPEAKKILAVMIEAYPSAPITTATVDTFAAMLESYPRAHVAEAARRLMATSKWFPSIAELLAETVRVTDGLPDPEEAWLSALRWQRADFKPEAKPHQAVIDAVRASGGTFAMKTAPAHEWKRMFDAAYKGVHKIAFDRLLEVTLPEIEKATRAAIKSGMAVPPGLLPKTAGAES